jgi:V-type H+-transporting ATPase subunit a
MFGDIAHGLILFAFGLYLTLNHKNINNFILKMLVPHRYLFALMGFFATFCGFIYNDFLSISLNLFDSCYNLDNITEGNPIPRISPECVYSFGLDPIWSVSSNYLNYVNSLKMKIAVIIGVVHMILGVFVKASNSLYFKRYI